MPRIRLPVIAVIAGWVVACGSSSDSTTDPNNGGNAGGGRTMTATFNGVAFVPTTLTSGYLNGQVTVGAIDASHNFLLNAINVSATGTYSVSPGNPNSALVQWIDNTGAYSTGFTGGTGTVTFTVLQLGRVAGSFDLVVKNTSTGSTTTIALKGTFDIKFP